MLRHQAVPSSVIGLALGIGAAGGLAGAPLIRTLHRLRPGVLTLAAVEAVAVACCATRRELWQARWPSETAPDGHRHR